MLRSVGGRPIRQSVSSSFYRAYTPSFRVWTTFRRLIRAANYFYLAAFDTGKILAVLEFVAWCVSEGNQAGTIAGKLSAVLHFHRVNLQMELPTSSPLIKRALKGVVRPNIAAGTPKRVRRSISWDARLGEQDLASSWGPGGRILWMSLALCNLFAARSNEIFASPTGVVHPVHA